jgi:phosphohistidine phosphatase
MSRQLLLMRHAKSSWEDTGLDDIERAVAERGIKDIEQVSKKLVSNQLIPDIIICSPAKRARETASILCRCLDRPEQIIKIADALYLADLPTLLTNVTGLHDSLYMLVGHNPGLDELMVYLCGENLPLTKKGKLMTTAAVAWLKLPELETDNHIAPGSATLCELFRP